MDHRPASAPCHAGSRGRARGAFATVAAACWLVAAPTAQADSAYAMGNGPGKAQAGLRVVVDVPRVVHLRVLAQPQQLQVTADDIERGYVDVADPMRVAVHANLRDGYGLALSQLSPVFEAAVLHGLGQDLTVRQEAHVRRAPTGRGLYRDELALSVRLTLARDAKPGSYAWPIRVSALSL